MNTGELAVIISAIALASTLILNAWRGSRSSGADSYKLNLLDAESKKHTTALTELGETAARQDEINKSQAEFNKKRERKEAELDGRLNRLQGGWDARERANERGR